MANIVIIHCGGVLDKGKYRTFVYYEGLINAFTKNGNNVLEIITNDLLKKPWSGANTLKWEINKKKLKKDILNFNPDLIISFNNSSIEGLEKVVTCPIVVWSADHLYHFNDLDKLKANKSRYIFFCLQSGDVDDCVNILGADPKKCHFVKPATAVRGDVACEKKNNIIFIGTPFGNHEEKIKLHQHREIYVPLAKKIINKTESDDKLVEEYKAIPNIEQTLLDFGAVANRTNTLAHVAPLGISIHGGAGWLDVGLDSSLDIFKSYNPENIFSVEQTEKAYNSAKIGLNINHTQAKTGYSWRVMDILASSAALVSSYSPDLENLLGDLAKDVLYRTPREAHEICAKLLADENLRVDIVKRSNEIVRNKHTWEIRISEIEKILNVKLTDQLCPEGKYYILNTKKYRNILFVIFKKDMFKKIIRFILPHSIVKNSSILKIFIKRQRN